MTTPAATRAVPSTWAAPVLYLAFELGQAKWKLGFRPGLGQRPRQRTIGARDVRLLAQELERAKERFALPGDVPVVSCYEAGREGFWLHRWLECHGITNHVVDSASIEVIGPGSGRCGAWCGCRRWRRRIGGSCTGSC